MSFLIMVVCVGLCVAFPGSILSVYTNEEALLVESVSALYVVCGAMLIASLANVYFNGISGTGNTQAALVLEVFVGQYAGGVGIGSVCTSFLCTLYHCGGHGYPGTGGRMLHHGSDLLRIDVRFQSHLSEKSKMAEQKDLSILIFL